MKLNPLSDILLLKQAKAEEKTSSGIILASSKTQTTGCYEVVAVGPKVTIAVQPGERVVVGRYGGVELKVEGVDYKFVRQDDIVAVATEEY